MLLLLHLADRLDLTSFGRGGSGAPADDMA
jgi:hypothetical protein